MKKWGSLAAIMACGIQAAAASELREITRRCNGVLGPVILAQCLKRTNYENVVQGIGRRDRLLKEKDNRMKELPNLKPRTPDEYAHALEPSTGFLADGIGVELEEQGMSGAAPAGDEVTRINGLRRGVGMEVTKEFRNSYVGLGVKVEYQYESGEIGGSGDLRGTEVRGQGWSVGPFVVSVTPLIH